MLINENVLYEQLSKYYSLQYFGDSSFAWHLHFPLLFCQDLTPSEDQIYVGSAESLSAVHRFPSGCCIISSGLPDSVCTEDNVSWIVTDAGVPVLSLLNAVQSVFEQISSWDQQLNGMIRSDSPISDYLFASQFLFDGFFLLILDIDYRILATTGDPSFVMDSDGRAYSSVVSRLNKDPAYVAMRFEKKTFLYRGKYFDHGILTHHIFINDQLSGTFTLTEHGKTVTNGRWALFEHLSVFVDYYYRNKFSHMYRSINIAHALFYDYFNNGTLNNNELDRCFEKIRWNSNDSLRTGVIQIDNSIQKIISVPYLCQQLERRFDCIIAFGFRQNIAVIINETKRSAQADYFREEIQNFLMQFSLFLGVSSMFHNILSARTYYEQAIIALDIGKQKDRDEQIYFFDDFRLQYMISNCTGSLLPETLCPETLLLLRNLDEARGSEYVKTLTVFFEDGCNATQASRDLFINRSTFIDRMNKIRDYLEVDLDDYDTRLYLMLCLKLLKTDHIFPSKSKKQLAKSAENADN